MSYRSQIDRLKMNGWIAEISTLKQTLYVGLVCRTINGPILCIDVEWERVTFLIPFFDEFRRSQLTEELQQHSVSVECVRMTKWQLLPNSHLDWTPSHRRMALNPYRPTPSSPVGSSCLQMTKLWSVDRFQCYAISKFVDSPTSRASSSISYGDLLK